MAVTAHPKDLSGQALDTKIINLTAAAANTSSTLTKSQVATNLDLAQREAVNHYLERGRISAATILSTLS